MAKVKKETFVLEGKEALLLAEGCKQNKIKKEAESRLAEIRDEIGLKKEGVYTNSAGDKLDVSTLPKFSDVNPKDVLDYLKKIKMTARFPEVIKVQITPLRKIVPESTIDGWRVELDPTIKFSWK